MNATKTGAEQVRFTAIEIPGRGRTVVQRTGSKRTGRTEERVADVGDRLTMHTAQAIASTLQRDFSRHGV